MSEENLPTVKPAAKSALPIVFGFIAGALFWLPPFVVRNESALGWIIIVPFAEPLVGLGFALYSPTRKFGLGVLLASGLGWLALGAMCSGMLR